MSKVMTEGIRWAIDPGHTRLKLAIFDGLTVVRSGAWSWDALRANDLPWKDWPAPVGVGTGAGVYALDRAGAGERLKQLWWPGEVRMIGHGDVGHFDHDYVDFKSGRQGMDRWANMAACHAADPAGANIIVDAGTCTTIDLRVAGRLLGGAIVPGVAMRARALASGTDTLPAVELAWGKTGEIQFPGQSTEGTIAAGVVCGAVEECGGLVRRLLANSPEAGIIVTGGGAQYFDRLPGLLTFADSLLTLKGVLALADHLEDAPLTS
jgi:pantothenate kinase type III